MDYQYYLQGSQMIDMLGYAEQPMASLLIKNAEGI
jgi:hypothetical protein